jgi:hypothetical protein
MRNKFQMALLCIALAMPASSAAGAASMPRQDRVLKSSPDAQKEGQSAQLIKTVEPKPLAPQKPKRTAMKIPEPGSLILFGVAILLLLVARSFGRARHQPLAEEKWLQD